MSTTTSRALATFYCLRFAATGTSMLSVVLLPWLVYTATHRIEAAGAVMLLEAAVRLLMSLYGGQLAHALGGRLAFTMSQALCAAGFGLFAGVLFAYPHSTAWAMALVAVALLFMQSGVTLGNVVTEACTVAFVQGGAASVPARVRGIDLWATACALPLAGWLVFAFAAPLALIALGAAFALGAAVSTARSGAAFGNADTAVPVRFSLVDARVWAWLARTRRARLQTAFLLLISVPVTMLFGALPFLLADKLPAGLPDWVKPTDVLFLTHYKALEALAAALVLVAWARWARKPGRSVTAATFSLAGYLAALVALTSSGSALAVAFAALALAACFSPLLVWVRQKRAELVPSGHRHRVSGVLVAIDSLAYVLGALVVQTVGFAPPALGAFALAAALAFLLLVLGLRAGASTRGTTAVALPGLDEKLAVYRRFLADHRPAIEARLADAVPRLGLFKRAVAPPTLLTPLAAAPIVDIRPIGCGLTPMVLPRSLIDAGLRTARVAARSEEVAATRRPLASIRADAQAQGWSPAVLAHLLPESPFELKSRLAASFHRLRVDLLVRPGPDRASPDDLDGEDTLAGRFAPLEVNNGGSQGHWICSSVNDVLLAGVGVEGARIFEKPHALIVDVYDQFNAWLKETLGARQFRRLFPRGAAPLAFVSGPYSGRMVNDIEGPRIADFIARRYGVEARYFVGLDDLEVATAIRLKDRSMAMVRSRDAPGERFVVWGDFYLTECMDYFQTALASPDARTRELAELVLGGRVLGISSWPGRELLENDKGHLVDKAAAIEHRSALGLTADEAELLQRAAPPAFSITGTGHAERLCAEREQWVVKARFGCGGSAVIVGAKASWPTQKLPAVETAADGTKRVRHHAIGELADVAGISLHLDAEGRITPSSWAQLWPHLMRYAVESPGYYVAQARVEPTPYPAVIFDGHRIDEFPATTDFAAAYTLGWRNGKPHVRPSGTLCRAVPAGHPHTNITTRGALLPVMSEDEFDRLYLALGLDRYPVPHSAGRPAAVNPAGQVAPGVAA